MEDSVDGIISQWAHARPGMDVSPMGVFGRLSRLSRVLERQLQTVFSQHGLLPGEFDLLATLVRADIDGDGLTAGELAGSAMITSGAVTNRLDRLAAKGLVTRDVDPNNRRTIRVKLTKHGQEVVDAALKDHVANEERLLAGLTDIQRNQLEDLLRTLLRSYES